MHTYLCIFYYLSAIKGPTHVLPGMLKDIPPVAIWKCKLWVSLNFNVFLDATTWNSNDCIKICINILRKIYVR